VDSFWIEFVQVSAGTMTLQSNEKMTDSERATIKFMIQSNFLPTIHCFRYNEVVLPTRLGRNGRAILQDGS